MASEGKCGKKVNLLDISALLQKDPNEKQTELIMWSRLSIILIFLCGFVFAFFVTTIPGPHFLWLTFRRIPLASSLNFGEDGSPKQPVVSTGLDLPTEHGKARADYPLTLPAQLQSKPTQKTDHSGEVAASLHLAKEMRLHGKRDKATKLYQHALALDPHNVEVLTEYGEFLEEEHNYMEADHMYTKALTVRPGHTQALTNRLRTLPQVMEYERRYFTAIDKKRDLLIQVPLNNAALRRIKQESYYFYIYHTNAIEGNTLSLGQTRAILETRMAVGGKSIVEHNEVIGMDEAMKYLNNTLMDRIGAIRIEDIMEIHRRVLGHCDPLDAGHYRRTQVYVGRHIPPHPIEVENKMLEFNEWLNSDEALSLHPIQFAAIAHYKLVFIHPFVDGNGRTARLLMNLILMQAGFPPVTIKLEERHEYYEALVKANEGDVRPFVQFVAKCTERTLDEYLYAVEENPTKDWPHLSRLDDGKVIIID
ncbi:hypothetical protein Bbelb_170580 [Branchiostoma belcheri]|nr:hypothetical protein Bbelb_170580 [Branchiostoma belcheri]